MSSGWAETGMDIVGLLSPIALWLAGRSARNVERIEGRLHKVETEGLGKLATKEDLTELRKDLRAVNDSLGKLALLVARVADRQGLAP